MKKSIGLFLFASMIMLIFSSNIHAALLISELDCDTAGTDIAEFVEILNTGPDPYDFSGNHVVLVFFNGSDDASYRAVDLEGTLDPGGVLVVGQPAVLPAPDIVIESSFVQNGADAVALYAGEASDWVNDTPAVEGYIDALVYDTGQDADVVLLEIFDVFDGIQVNENTNGDKDHESIQRVEAGIGGSHFIVGPATPGESTLVPVPGAVYLLSSGLIALVWMRSRSKEECVVGNYKASHR